MEQKYIQVTNILKDFYLFVWESESTAIGTAPYLKALSYIFNLKKMYDSIHITQNNNNQALSHIDYFTLYHNLYV